LDLIAVEGMKCGKASLIRLLKYDHTNSISSDMGQGVKSELYKKAQILIIASKIH